MKYTKYRMVVNTLNTRGMDIVLPKLRFDEVLKYYKEVVAKNNREFRDTPENKEQRITMDMDIIDKDTYTITRHYIKDGDTYIYLDTLECKNGYHFT